ncbi:PREDICTED: oocyte zinc finger protein XlCOF22-like [Cyprinodon variegatus]|uniref:Oocyte zinc finger protein XlCOF22-like n=1 Tax=Cyprinodon variegatus TaxID=28743 RepID=A0A3Q2D9J6_CYPVA|nr:PREDICTED: oocyte zinc finger protein XlCOF22-like [Cyprinodon variegatus]
MASVLPLRGFIRQKLDAAAEEIFSEVEKSIRLLEMSLREQLIQQLTELHQQKVSEEDVLDDPQLWTGGRSHSLDQEEAEPPPGQEQVQLPGNLKTEGRPGGSDRGPVQMEELDLKQQLLDTSCKLEIESHRSESPHGPEEVLADREIWTHGPTRNADQEETEPPWIKQNQEEPQPLWINQNQEETGSLHIKQDEEDPEPPWIKQNQEEDSVYSEERLLIHQNFNPVPSDEESDQREPEPVPEQVHSDTSDGGHVESEPSERSLNVSQTKKQQYEESSSGSESLGGFGPGFSRTSSLMSHIRTSSPEEAFSAGLLAVEPSSSSQPHHPFLVGHAGTPSSQLLAANSKRRTRTAESLYSCGSCGKRFRFHCRYLSHLRTHTGEKPFSCGECGKRFTQGGSLWRHVRTHSGEKPFLCRTCGKSFTQKSGLLGHIRTQHAAKQPCSG